MRFLAEEHYLRTDECLRFLRAVDGDRDPAPAPCPRERCHLYWTGKPPRKLAFALKSFLATQDLESMELWLWLDGEYPIQEDAIFQPLLPFIQVKRFNAEVEARGTPLERRLELYHAPPNRGLLEVARCDFARYVVLYNYGGIYVDVDMMLLRDLRPLLRDPRFGPEFCYRWSMRPYANSAFMRLARQSPTAAALMARCVELGSCHPRRVLAFDATREIDLVVLPSTFFDPLWLIHHGRDRSAIAPLQRFDRFFRPFGWLHRRRATIRSHRDFFPGAFAFHWHNQWDAPEHRSSYFGLFNEEFDTELREKLHLRL